MSDPKRATLITVGASKSEKKKVNKTVRLTINLDESNESKYPELNYKKLVIAEERKKKVENGKRVEEAGGGLNPYSDNDEDVERVARKFEQKYGGNSTYGRKGRSKRDDFADIGAGYDENDSFIDNTDGYDEMIPPECDTLYGGFYINSGSLEFKNVSENHEVMSDGELGAGRRSKRRISSSSSGDESTSSSSESESADEKDPRAVVNGAVDLLNIEHRKKNKKIDKKAKKVRRTDSSAPTSGKQTSDENNHGDAESADSRTSQSDSLTSKPAPSSENAITSDSSRDVEAKVEVKLLPAVSQVLEELEAAISRQLIANPSTTAREMETRTEQYVSRLEVTLARCNAEARMSRMAYARAARALNLPRSKLVLKARALSAAGVEVPSETPDAGSTSAQPVIANPANQSSLPTSVPTSLPTPNHHKRKAEELLEDIDISRMTDEEREAKIVDTLRRLKALIEERRPAMMASYNAECERVQEERKKIQIAQAAAADGAPPVEKRLPKRRFPWCPRSRALLARLKRLAGEHDAAAALLAKRALPLFPAGFVRMPTLLRQADLSKEIKVTDFKRQRVGSVSHPPQPTQPQPTQFQEPIQFPSSLTVTTSAARTQDKNETPILNDDKDSKYKNSSIFGSIISSFSLNKDLVVEPSKQEDRKTSVILPLTLDKGKEDLYIPPNSIGSITITPVPINQTKTDKKVNSATTTDKHKEPLIKVKSPAALNDMVSKKEKDKALETINKKDKDKHKKLEKTVSKEKRTDSPLHIDTSYQPKQKEPTPSPKSKAEEVTQKQIENMRVAENNIPRPALVPVHHSPTFAKPDKRPPEIKKKKDLLIVSDLDPLGDIQQEPVAIDDSSSDVEVIEDTKSDIPSEKSDSVPLKDKVSVRDSNNSNHKNVDGARQSKEVSKDGKVKDGEKKGDKLDAATKEDFDSLMKDLRDLEHSQKTPKLSSNSFGGVITSAKRGKSSGLTPFDSRASLFGEPRSDKDKLVTPPPVTAVFIY